MSDQPPVKIPRVGQPRGRTAIAPYALGLGVLGTAVFASLASNRAEREEQGSALPPLRATTMTAPAPPPPVAVPVAVPVGIPMTSVPQPAPPVAVQPQRPAYYGPPPAPRPSPTINEGAERARARVLAPALIVDLGPTKTSEFTPETQVLGPAVPPAAGLFRFASVQQQQDPVGASIAAAGPPAEAVAVIEPVGGTIRTITPRDLNANERFSERAGGREIEVARAQRLPNQDMLVTQGTIIGAVMETALNSDVPGMARAIVSRDVLSFDGSQVLIPAGSRVIGEYNSGVAQGASRIFIVWNRLIRPDGVSVSIASPAVDDLGRGGLSGSVNRHLLQRYGAPILLSILSGGISAIAQSRANNGSTVVVTGSNGATALGQQATRGTDIPPTITTRQGALVRIFVARDLDFSPVGAN